MADRVLSTRPTLAGPPRNSGEILKRGASLGQDRNYQSLAGGYTLVVSC